MSFPEPLSQSQRDANRTFARRAASVTLGSVLPCGVAANSRLSANVDVGFQRCALMGSYAAARRPQKLPFAIYAA